MTDEKTTKGSVPAEPETEAETKQENVGDAKVRDGAKKAYEASSEAAKAAYDVTRDAAMSAFKAATVVVTDPMGGQSKAMAALGEKGSLAAGIFFVALFVVIAYLTSMFGGFGTHLKLIFLWVVQAAALFGCFYGLGVLFKQKLSIAGAIFSTGVTLFPLAVTLLLTGIGVFTGWIIGIILLYGFSILVLLIGGFLQDVLKASTQRAVILAPTVLAVVMLISWLYTRIFFSPNDFMFMFSAG